MQPRDGYALPRRPESVESARMWVRISLMGRYDDAIDPAVLIMSELATNAIQHADKTVTIRVTCEVGDDGILTLGVLDYGKREPVMLDAADDDEHGRGLVLVNALADEWGWHWCDVGKLVYARLKLPQAVASPWC
jgi:anti-sigma regulatory factor (Ser/Thr protein kinase)